MRDWVRTTALLYSLLLILIATWCGVIAMDTTPVLWACVPSLLFAAGFVGWLGWTSE